MKWWQFWHPDSGMAGGFLFGAGTWTLGFLFLAKCSV
jgi:hypothetical protein